MIEPTDPGLTIDRATAADPDATLPPGGVGDGPRATDADRTAGRAPGPAERPTTTQLDGPDGDGLPPGAAVRYFGDYEIRGELGRGGMGVVYQARQVSLNRPVALKMVKAGLLAGDDDLRRFKNEAEAVALLDHPGVVPVYEVGEHDGQNYFSMKLVPGGSLVPLLDRYKEDPKAAARLVAEAAEAVAHAHARGILHRDLKPANILVDDKGHPHVTDFGLAKRVEADVEITQSGAILGTPAYMSPEQASGHRGAVTTASDVYGLGAVLYALLTGRAPFGSSSVVETIDAVRNRPPEPPKRLNASVPRDLETICLKCLEKDPRRRYPSAQALADDLRAWLDARPIAARRVGAAERAWLWCRRRPAVAALSAGVLLATVGGVATTIAVQAAANRLLEGKNADLQRANERVMQRFDLAAEAIKLFHGQVGEDLVLKAPQFKPLRDALLMGALDFYGRLERLLLDQPDRGSREAMGSAYFELGELTRKIGDKVTALAAHRKALAVRQELAANPSAGALAKGDLARSLYTIADVLDETGHPDEALADYREACRIVERLPLTGPGSETRRDLLGSAYSGTGFVLGNTGKADEAIPALQRAVEILARLSDEYPGVSAFRQSLARTYARMFVCYTRIGKRAEALEASRQAVACHREVVRSNPAAAGHRGHLASGYFNLGLVLAESGQLAPALESYKQGLEIAEALIKENPAVTDFQSILARGHSNLGVLQAQMGRTVEAMAAYRRAATIQQRLADENPTYSELRRMLAITYLNLGNLQYEGGDPGAALETYSRGRVILEQLVRDNPAVVEFRKRLADFLFNIGWISTYVGELTVALESLQRALAIHQKLADENPGVADFRSAVAMCEAGIGSLAFGMGRPGEGLASSRRALAMRQELAVGDPSNPEYQSNLAESLGVVGVITMTEGRLAEAMDEFSREEATRSRLVERYPTVPAFKNGLASGLTARATALLRLGRPGEARALCDRAVGLRGPLLKDQPENTEFRLGQAQSLLRSGLARRDSGDLDDAVAMWKQADAAFEAVDAMPPEATLLHAGCHAMLSLAAGRPASGVSAGEAEVARAMELLRRASDRGLRNPSLYRRETALDPLRHRPDFWLLMMDLAFPADPFDRAD